MMTMLHLVEWIPNSATPHRWGETLGTWIPATPHHLGGTPLDSVAPRRLVAFPAHPQPVASPRTTRWIGSTVLCIKPLPSTRMLSREVLSQTAAMQ